MSEGKARTLKDFLPRQQEFCMEDVLPADVEGLTDLLQRHSKNVLLQIIDIQYTMDSVSDDDSYWLKLVDSLFKFHLVKQHYQGFIMVRGPPDITRKSYYKYVTSFSTTNLVRILSFPSFLLFSFLIFLHELILFSKFLALMLEKGMILSSFQFYLSFDASKRRPIFKDKTKRDSTNSRQYKTVNFSCDSSGNLWVFYFFVPIPAARKDKSINMIIDDEMIFSQVHTLFFIVF